MDTLLLSVFAATTILSNNAAPKDRNVYAKMADASYIQSGLSIEVETIKRGFNQLSQAQLNRIISQKQQGAIATGLLLHKCIETKTISYTFHF